MDEITKKQLRIAKIIHALCLTAIVVYFYIIYYVKTLSGMEQMLDGYTLNMVSVAIGIVTVFVIFLGYRMPGRHLNSSQKTISPGTPVYYSLLITQILRCTFFESVAIYGLLLGILGADWLIVIPFWVVAAATLIHTFPTEAKWKKILAKLNPNDYDNLIK